MGFEKFPGGIAVGLNENDLVFEGRRRFQMPARKRHSEINAVALRENPAALD
jgi:hypothetical protein